MDIYQIFVTHNRPWSARELICAGLLVAICCFLLAYAVRSRKLKKSQATATLALVIYLEIVFGSTVFTRLPATRQYQLLPFWSWRIVLQTHNKALFRQILLNSILLVPMGLLLPLIFDKKIRLSKAFLLGFLASAAIELCQLISSGGYLSGMI